MPAQVLKANGRIFVRGFVTYKIYAVCYIKMDDAVTHITGGDYFAGAALLDY
jgi:hypothetical protein